MMNKNENQDLIDLCKLNSIEENIKEKGIKEDQDEMQRAIDWKKRQVMNRIRYKFLPVDQVEKADTEEK